MFEATTPKFEKVPTCRLTSTVILHIQLYRNYPRDFLYYTLFGQKVGFL